MVPAHRQILVTGGSGFVAPYVVAALRAMFGSEPRIVLSSRSPVPSERMGDCEQVALDLQDGRAVAEQVAALRPSACIHLAGISHVTTSAKDPDLAWRVNVAGTIALAEAILAGAPDCRLIHVSSGEVYGLSANEADRLDETALLKPANPYAVTKAAADLAIGEMALRGLKAVRMRPFNHTGPGQAPNLVVPGIAAQIARIERTGAGGTIQVGALDRSRDFLDVRDVARAYALALARFDDLPPGTILNVASGITRTIGSVLEDLLGLASVPITVQQNPSLLRPADVTAVRGAAERARALIGWQPEIDWPETLRDVLNDWRTQVERHAGVS